MEGEKAAKKTFLIVAPPLELGWLLPYIARARYKAQKYENVVVICEAPFEYLFQDFATIIKTYPVQKCKRDRWVFDEKFMPSVLMANEYKADKIWYPTEDRCKRKEAKWFRYGSVNNLAENVFDEWTIFIHARNLPSVHYDKKYGKRTWPDTKWEKLVQCFPETLIRSIGSMGGAKHIPNTFDARGYSLQDLCNILAKSKVIVGPSSGPMHLAMLCGCSVVVWSHNIKEKSLDGHNNEWRYKHFMNPFNARCEFIKSNNWNPEVSTVVEATRRVLNETN